MEHANSLPSPMASGDRLSAHGSETIEDVSLYRSLVGVLQYATITRPELSFAVNKISQFMQTPQLSHLKDLRKILHYIRGTLDYGLTFHPSSSLDLVGFCDADWASDLDDRRSTSGYCVFLGQNLISWTSKKKHTVSRSSTEAEYRSLAHVTTEVTWLQSLLSKLKVTLPSIPLVWCDNLSIVLMAANPVQHARTKHVELDMYFVREKVASQQLVVKQVPSTHQVADILTKPLTAISFGTNLECLCFPL